MKLASRALADACIPLQLIQIRGLVATLAYGGFVCGACGAGVVTGRIQYEPVRHLVNEIVVCRLDVHSFDLERVGLLLVVQGVHKSLQRHRDAVLVSQLLQLEGVQYLDSAGRSLDLDRRV